MTIMIGTKTCKLIIMYLQFMYTKYDKEIC